MVLGGEDDTFHASLFADSRPLPAVEVRGVKQLRVFIAETPLLIGVRVQRVVDKRVHLHILPAQLVLIRQRSEWLLLRLGCHAHTGAEHHHNNRYSLHFRYILPQRYGFFPTYTILFYKLK